MLRINLLPAYILERRKTRVAIVAFSALFAVVTVGMIGWYFTLSSQVAQRQAEADSEEQKAIAVTALATEATNTRGSIGPIRDKVKFVNDVLFYNTLRPRIFRNVAAYTYQNVEYNEMTISGQTLSIKAWTRNVSDVGRFLITMFGNPDLSAVSVAGIPGWPPPAPGTAGQGGEGGSGAPGGPGPEFGSGSGAPPMEAPSMPGGSGGSGEGGAPGGGGAAGFNPYFDPNNPYASLGIPAAPPAPPRKGFPFTVTAMLIKPVSPPSPPGAAAAGQQPGMSGEMGMSGSGSGI